MGLFELSILLFVVFLVLGPKRITNLLRALGRGARDFKTEFGGKDRDPELTEEDDRDANLRNK